MEAHALVEVSFAGYQAEGEEEIKRDIIDRKTVKLVRSTRHNKILAVRRKGE